MDKKSIFNRIFPIEHDFYEMLYKQAYTNALGVRALYAWLTNANPEDGASVTDYALEADKLRMDMEDKLTASFSTPFDRVDIYSISNGMDKVIEYAKSTAVSMRQFGIEPDAVIRGMAQKLQTGTDLFADSIGDLKRNPEKSGANIIKMRETHVLIEQYYRDGMESVFMGSDPMNALKLREIYHHIKDASEKLEDAVDILHRIVVRLT